MRLFLSLLLASFLAISGCTVDDDDVIDCDDVDDDATCTCDDGSEGQLICAGRSMTCACSQTGPSNDRDAGPGDTDTRGDDAN